MENSSETNTAAKNNFKIYGVGVILLALMFGLGYNVGEGRVKFTGGKI